MVDDTKSDGQKLKESSAAVRNWVAKQPAVKEESITDWLLYDVSQNISRITYRAFSRHAEARQTGADWEWWFLFPRFSARMRVQAKKIDRTRDNYPSIAYTNQHGLQIEKLLSDSKDKNFMPFYAFYTSLQESVTCPRQINDEGVFLAGGNRAYADFIKNGKKALQPADILLKCIPLSCFLCCPLCMGDAEGFLGFIARYYFLETGFETEEQARQSPRGQMRGVYREVPGYVTSFVEHARQELPDWWEREFRFDLEGTNALVVYDAR